MIAIFYTVKLAGMRRCKSYIRYPGSSQYFIIHYVVLKLRLTTTVKLNLWCLVIVIPNE